MRFEKFASAADKWDYQDIISRADREATEAERRFYHPGASSSAKVRCGQIYAECLKELITFMRYGIKPSRLDPGVARHFSRIREGAIKRIRPHRSIH